MAAAGAPMKRDIKMSVEMLQQMGAWSEASKTVKDEMKDLAREIRDRIKELKMEGGDPGQDSRLESLLRKKDAVEQQGFQIKNDMERIKQEQEAMKEQMRKWEIRDAWDKANETQMLKAIPLALRERQIGGETSTNLPSFRPGETSVNLPIFKERKDWGAKDALSKWFANLKGRGVSAGMSAVAEAEGILAGIGSSAPGVIGMAAGVLGGSFATGIGAVIAGMSLVGMDIRAQKESAEAEGLKALSVFNFLSGNRTQKDTFEDKFTDRVMNESLVEEGKVSNIVGSTAFAGAQAYYGLKGITNPEADLAEKAERDRQLELAKKQRHFGEHFAAQNTLFNLRADKDFAVRFRNAMWDKPGGARFSTIVQATQDLWALNPGGQRTVVEREVLVAMQIERANREQENRDVIAGLVVRSIPRRIEIENGTRTQAIWTEARTKRDYFTSQQWNKF